MQFSKDQRGTAQASLSQTLLPGSGMKLHYILSTDRIPALEAQTACKRSLSTYSSRWDSSKTVPEAELYAPLQAQDITQLFAIIVD